MTIRCPSCGDPNEVGAKFCGRCGSRLDVASGDPLIGRVIAGRYRIEKAVGEGGMGRVYYAAQQLGTASRGVAVKVLHAIHSKDPSLRQRFYGECEIVVQLTHPNTIQFYDFGELDDGRLYIVMEWIEGHSLAEAIDRGPIAVRRVERLLTQIAGSLGEAHSHGIVHRDLKPDNILLTVRGGEQDFVKVCDFGIAKRVESEGASLTLQGTLIGTPQYMSPEQLTGGELDARSDIYSLGLILFEMLTGQRPFSASSPMEWAAKHATAEPPSLDLFPATRDLPAEQKRAVMRALAKLPRDRQESVRQLAAELLGRSDASTPTEAAEIPSSERATSHRGLPSPPANSGWGGVSPAQSPSGSPRPVDVTAPTMHASPAAIRQAVGSPSPQPVSMSPSQSLSQTSAPMLQPTDETSGLAAAAWTVAILGLLVAAGGLTIFFLRDRIWPEDAPVPVQVVDAGVAVDPAPDAGPRSYIATEWIRIVLEQERVEDAANALGPPDNEYATIRPRGVMVLETTAGTRIEADGSAGPDLVINADDVRSGPYRAEVRTRQYEYVQLGSQLIGSLALDVDQFEVRRIRYVRITNPGGRNVYIDSVGAYRTIVVNPERYHREGGGPPPAQQ